MTPVVQSGIDTGGRRGLGVGAFLLAVLTAGAMAHVGVRMKGIEVAYDLGREKRVNKQLEEERRRLNIEIGMLKDPVRVVTFARDTLKMGPPAPTDIVKLAPGQVLGATAPEAPVPAKAKRATERPTVPRARVVTPAKTAPPKEERAAEAPAEAAASAEEPTPPPSEGAAE